MGKIKVGRYIIQTSSEDKILFPASKITKDCIKLMEKDLRNEIPAIADQTNILIQNCEKLESELIKIKQKYEILRHVSSERERIVKAQKEMSDVLTRSIECIHKLLDVKEGEE